MTSIPVATLAELGIKLGTALSIEDKAHLRWMPLYEAGRGNEDTPEIAACNAAYTMISDLIDQIAIVPAATLADLRVKAMAMDWHNRTIEKPSDFWELLGAEIVTGLLNEALANADPGSHLSSRDADIFGDARRGSGWDKRS